MRASPASGRGAGQQLRLRRPPRACGHIQLRSRVLSGVGEGPVFRRQLPRVAGPDVIVAAQPDPLVPAQLRRGRWQWQHRGPVRLDQVSRACPNGPDYTVVGPLNPPSELGVKVTWGGEPAARLERGLKEPFRRSTIPLDSGSGAATALPQRPDRGREPQDQDDQTADVRPGRIHPPTPPDPSQLATTDRHHRKCDRAVPETVPSMSAGLRCATESSGLGSAYRDGPVTRVAGWWGPAQRPRPCSSRSHVR